MDDLIPADTDSPQRSPAQQAGDDPDDPLRPEVDEENDERTPPLADPQQDLELAGEDGSDADNAAANDDDDDDQDDNDDNESDLSEIDEAELENFDPANIAIDERPEGPVAVDETNVDRLGTHKRKRAPGDEGEQKKKRKEKKREKTRKVRRADSDDVFSGGEEVQGKRRAKKKDGVQAEREPRRAREATPDEMLTPEERRKRALDKAMDDALRNPNARGRRMKGIDLEAANDEMIEEMRQKMARAAKLDADARQEGLPATHKLKMLPDVISLLNRNNLRDILVDPETNILESVRFFLEPLNDGSLPAYNIQRELFAVMRRLPIDKQALIASGIGKVVLFYTKSPKAEIPIKRQAEKLMGEWTRPILKRSDDFRKRALEERFYDARAAPTRTAPTLPAAEQARLAARERKLAPPTVNNRARLEGGVASYSIVPRARAIAPNMYSRPIGSGSDEAFRKMKARTLGKR